MGDIESVSESNNSSFLETEIDDYEWESSYESELVHAKEYIPWALEHEKVDDVSFASFVQGYEFMDLEDVKSVYEMLISSSLEKRDTKTKFRIVATKSVREVQSASMKEIAEKAKLLVSDIGDQSETAYRPKSKRKIEDLEHNYHGPRVGEKSHKLAASGQNAQPYPFHGPSILDLHSHKSSGSLVPTPTQSNSSTSLPPKHDKGRSSSLTIDSISERNLFADPTSLTVYKYVSNGHNIAQFPTNIKDLRHRFVWNSTRFSNSVVEMCGRLDQLALGEDIQDDTSDPDLRRIVVLYEMVALTLPLDFDLFSNGLEDTYCHHVTDALFAYQFPRRSKKFIVVWANSEAHGSKVRRGFGCKPDGVIVSQRSKFNVMGVGFALTRYVVVRTIDLFEVMN
ncbi:hypothetical protein BGX20_004844 [Mortierella sp. AD010]|nr:hypothetical protein BGX20_004844 [Mortierella sp. AD010]